MDQYLIRYDWSVQPNGTILSQYKQHFDFSVRSSSKKNHSPSPSDDEKTQQRKKQKQQKLQRQKDKQIIRQKLQNVIDEVVSFSRKLFREAYQKGLNQLIADKRLVYFRAKYSVIVIVVVKKFSCDFEQIQQLIDKVFNWFYEKCTSMNIELSLANRKMSMYQLGQFRKLQWEIAHQIGQKLAVSEIKKEQIIPKISTEEFVKDKVHAIAGVIQNRNNKLEQISEKISFKQMGSSKNLVNQDNLQFSQDASFVKKCIESLFFLFKKKDNNRPRKFKRQLSFMDKSIILAKQMRIRKFLFYICLIVALTLGSMVYFGWFRENDDY